MLSQILVAWKTSSAATWPTHFLLASRSSYSASEPLWAFLLCCCWLGGFQSWGLQATLKPSQLTSCPGPPATAQLSPGTAGAKWSPSGPFCLLMGTPGRLHVLLHIQTCGREWSLNIPASTKGQPQGQWPWLKFTMLGQPPGGQSPLEDHLPALMFRFFLSQRFFSFPTAHILCFLSQLLFMVVQPAKNKNNGFSKWWRSIKSQLGSCLIMEHEMFGSGIMVV